MLTNLFLNKDLATHQKSVNENLQLSDFKIGEYLLVVSPGTSILAQKKIVNDQYVVKLLPNNKIIYDLPTGSRKFARIDSKFELFKLYLNCIIYRILNSYEVN